MTAASLTFIFGLGLFLTGIFLFARYAERILGSDVKNLLKRAEGHKWFYLLLGTSTTAVVQSSSVISSIVVGLVGGGMISIISGILLLVGASIGSTVTAQIIALPVVEYGPLLVAVGLVFWSFGLKGKYVKMVGIGLSSLGLLFIGLLLMTSAFTGLEETNWLVSHIGHFAAYPWYMFLAGMLTTIVLQSSSVTVGIAMAMVVGGVIDPLAAIPFVIGSTTGTNITVNLASLITSRAGKIVARGFFAFRLAVAVLAMLILAPFGTLVEWLTADPNSARFVANAYTLFNVLAAVPAFFLVKQIARAGTHLSPAGEISLGEWVISRRRKKNDCLGK